jgi:hypothetical protein
MESGGGGENPVMINFHHLGNWQQFDIAALPLCPLDVPAHKTDKIPSCSPLPFPPPPPLTPPSPLPPAKLNLRHSLSVPLATAKKSAKGGGRGYKMPGVLQIVRLGSRNMLAREGWQKFPFSADNSGDRGSGLFFPRHCLRRIPMGEAEMGMSEYRSGWRFE